MNDGKWKMENGTKEDIIQGRPQPETGRSSPWRPGSSLISPRHRLRSTFPYNHTPFLQLRVPPQLTPRCRVFSRSSPPSRLPPPLLFSATTMATRSAGRCSASARPYSNSKPWLSPCWACTWQCILWERSSTEGEPGLRKFITGGFAETAR